MNQTQQVTDYITAAPEAQQELLTTLRELIASSVPGCEEAFKWSQPVYAMKKDFCYIKSNKEHVNLGFTQFEKVEDPKGLLEGTGKSMRHIKLRNVADVDKTLFAKMIKQAASF